MDRLVISIPIPPAPTPLHSAHHAALSSIAPPSPAISIPYTLLIRQWSQSGIYRRWQHPDRAHRIHRRQQQTDWLVFTSHLRHTRSMEKEAAAAAEQQPVQEQEQPVQEQEQWRGAVEAALPSTPASAAWPHIASFCALDRYLPGIDVCELAAGVDGKPGCVRYVAALAPAAAAAAAAGDDGEQREVASWAREELLELDGGARRLAYAVVGSSMGFGRYVASMTVAADEDDAEAAGCRLAWAFECEPVQGWSLDGLLGYLQAGVNAIAARIEEAEAAAAAGAAGGDAVAA